MTQVDQGVSGLLTDLYIEDANAAVGAAEEAAASWAATASRARAEIEGVLDYTESHYLVLSWVR